MAGKRPSMFSIGDIIGGSTPNNLGWTSALTDLCRSVAALREDRESDFRLNVVFHVPGNLWAPDFAGIRTGAFRKAERQLMVQVALPPTSPPNARDVLIGYLFDCLDVVDAWAKKKKVAVELEQFREILQLLQPSTDMGPIPVTGARNETEAPRNVAHSSHGTVHLLVLQWPLEGSGDFDALVEMEDLLSEGLIPEAGVVDGHDFGAGEMNIFIDTDSPIDLFAKIASLIGSHPRWSSVRVAYRSNGDDDTGFKPIWPSGLRDFKISP